MWDDQGDGTNTAPAVPEWLKDLMPKSAPGPPPGIKPENYKSFEMDAAQIRALIGRGGETVQGIRAKSGAEVKIDHTLSEQTGRVTIVGDVEKTEAMIREALAGKGVPLGGIPPPPPGLPPPSIMDAAGMPGVVPPPPGVPLVIPPSGGRPAATLALPAGTPATAGLVPMAGQANAPPTGPVETREVMIPQEFVGGMIGPGGATINELRKQAGAFVKLPCFQPPSLAATRPAASQEHRQRSITQR